VWVYSNGAALPGTWSSTSPSDDPAPTVTVGGGGGHGEDATVSILLVAPPTAGGAEVVSGTYPLHLHIWIIDDSPSISFSFVIAGNTVTITDDFGTAEEPAEKTVYWDTTLESDGAYLIDISDAKWDGTAFAGAMGRENLPCDVVITNGGSEGSDLTVTGADIDNGSGGNVIATDTQCRILATVGQAGVDVLDYVRYMLYRTRGLVVSFIGDYIDTTPVVGLNTHYFTGLSLQTGDILATYIRAYDTNGDWAQDDTTENVGGVGYKSLILGDDVADFAGWALTDVVQSGSDLILAATGDVKYKATGTIQLDFDSGYDTSVWTLISFVTNLPAGTGINFKVKSAPTQLLLDDATYSVAITESGYSLEDIVDTNRWVRVLATLATTDIDVTPVLQSLELFYSSEAGDSSSKTWDTTADFEEWTLDGTVVEDGFVYLDSTEINEYSSPGMFLLRLDAGVYVEWLNLVYDADVPANTTLTFRTRSYEDISRAEEADWDACVGPIISEDGMYLDIEVTLTSTDINASPLIRSITVDFQQTVIPDVKYVFTAKFILPSVLGGLMVADVEYNQDPAATVQFRFAANDDTVWADMLPIKTEEFMKVLTAEYLSGTNLRVAAKIVNCSDTVQGRLDEFSVLFSLENGQRLQVL